MTLWREEKIVTCSLEAESIIFLYFMQSSTFQEFEFSSLINFMVKDFNTICKPPVLRRRRRLEKLPFAEIIFLLEIRRVRISGAALLETRQNVLSADRL